MKPKHKNDKFEVGKEAEKCDYSSNEAVYKKNKKNQKKFQITLYKQGDPRYNKIRQFARHTFKSVSKSIMARWSSG
ncbi:hypothetical protein ACFQ4N_13540 [Oceanobacillus iheyensis]|uniref:hypothetical protein n=1 Tax=Oceanobacillus iheyensis TaxID=182710 RepID=UPI0009D752DC|nr:hypothetical protein [Oceanobacillus iheyensis]